MATTTAEAAAGGAPSSTASGKQRGASGAEGSSLRLQKAIGAKIKEGLYYDAHQLVLTLRSRHVARGRFDDAVAMCFDFARRFAEMGKCELTIDLGLQILSIFEEEKKFSFGDSDDDAAEEASKREERLERLCMIFDLCADSKSKDKYKFINRCLRYSSTAKCPQGSVELHRRAAVAYRTDKSFGNCQGHLLYCKDGPALADMVKEWRVLGYPSERPLFTARVVLMLLYGNDLPTAEDFINAMQIDFDDPEVPPPEQFAYLLIEACKARNRAFFETLRAKYQLVIRRDASFDKYLLEVEKLYFEPRADRIDNPFMRLINSFLEGDNSASSSHNNSLG